MNRDEVSRDINKSWKFLKALDLGAIFSNPAPLVASDDFIDLALSKTAKYEDVFLSGLRNGDYNIQLVDYSFLQFSISTESHVRFAYYPNPFFGANAEAIGELSQLEEFVREGAMSYEEYLAQVSELRNSQHPPLLRYDNAPSQYDPALHPCSHFHLGHHSENRWSVQRSLTAYAFALLIARQFYFSRWSSVQTLKLFEHEGVPDSFLATAKQGCRMLPDALFSKGEGQLFFFN